MGHYFRIREPQVWEDKWRPLDENHRFGGQGSVRRVTSALSGVAGGLKEMHRDSLHITERRFRFQQEANALLALQDCPGTPGLLDCNCELWSEAVIPLYLVMEWIEGPTLTEVGPLPPGEALAVFEALIRTLEKLEELDVRHRDIKPDNIILRASEISDPVIVDFGLSWSPREGEVHFRTPAGQELGNRFLRLPEYAPGRDHRDSRSDLTLAVGLLFFMICGRAPRILQDAEGRLPHEAHASSFAANVIDDPIWSVIRRIFQVGFQPLLERRFQNAGQILDFLAAAKDAVNVTQNDEVDREIRALQDLLQSERGRARDEAAEALSKASRTFLETFQSVIGGAGLAAGGGGPNIVDEGLSVVKSEMAFFIVRQGTSQPMARFSHVVRFEGGSVACTVDVEGEDQEAYHSGPVADAEGLNTAAATKAREVAAKLIRLLTKKLNS